MLLLAGAAEVTRALFVFFDKETFRTLITTTPLFLGHLGFLGHLLLLSVSMPFNKNEQVHVAKHTY